jgi:hypothetical protein
MGDTDVQLAKIVITTQIRLHCIYNDFDGADGISDSAVHQNHQNEHKLF